MSRESFIPAIAVLTCPPFPSTYCASPRQPLAYDLLPELSPAFTRLPAVD